ncbi:MAG: hypothetical protein ACPIOQ_52685, partial [Promethearchaeia archaeon]
APPFPLLFITAHCSLVFFKERCHERHQNTYPLRGLRHLDHFRKARSRQRTRASSHVWIRLVRGIDTAPHLDEAPSHLIVMLGREGEHLEALRRICCPEFSQRAQVLELRGR